MRRFAVVCVTAAAFAPSAAAKELPRSLVVVGAHGRSAQLRITARDWHDVGAPVPRGVRPGGPHLLLYAVYRCCGRSSPIRWYERSGVACQRIGCSLIGGRLAWRIRTLRLPTLCGRPQFPRPCRS